MLPNYWEAGHAAKIDVNNFRGHFQYLEQLPDYPYAELCAALANDKRLEFLGEDNDFGCVTSQYNGLTVSRDLIDSCYEIDFLEGFFGPKLQTMEVLDIGAGYGRLCHRFMRLYSKARFYNTDTIPVSQDCCRQYLARRGVWNSYVLPPDRLVPVELAINIHSWPECTRADIKFWLDKLCGLGVPYLFVVPHPHGVPFYCQDGVFSDLIASAGYNLVHSKEQHPACWPRTFHLYKRG